MYFCQGNKKLPDSTAGALWMQDPWAGRERKRGALGQWTKRAKATGAGAPEPGGRSPRQPRGHCAHTALSEAGNGAYGTEHSAPMERLNSSLLQIPASGQRRYSDMKVLRAAAFLTSLGTRPAFKWAPGGETKRRQYSAWEHSRNNLCLQLLLCGAALPSENPEPTLNPSADIPFPFF